MNKSDYPNFPLSELHAHLATSINPSVYWQIAHAQGFKLPKRDYIEFIDHVMLTENRKMDLNQYFDEIYHPLLDKLSSGTWALEKATYEIMTGAYRNGIKLIELRLNPMKHNRESELDLDHISLSILRGMERALLEYSDLRAGIIFCMAREFNFEQNSIIVDKAIKYHKRGIVGIDIAGPVSEKFKISEYTEIINKARNSGLGITVHSGEVGDPSEMIEIIDNLSPSRIGHGIKAAYNQNALEKIREKNIVLEVCPLSNLMTNAVGSVEELRKILRIFVENQIKFTINTDWPEVIENAHLYKQYRFLRDEKILNEEELRRCNQIGFDCTFIPDGGLSAYL